MSEVKSSTTPVPKTATATPSRLLLMRVMSNGTAATALVTLLFFAIVAIAAPLIAPYDPYQVFPQLSLLPPSSTHWMGTDLLGRDIFSRVIHGGRISLLIGFVSVGIAAAVGVVMGLLAGYYGGLLDNLVMRVIDTLMAFPGILLALAIVALLGPGLVNVMIAVGVGGIANYARLVRASVLSIKEEMYVEAARSVGVRDRRIIFDMFFLMRCRPFSCWPACHMAGLC